LHHSKRRKFRRLILVPRAGNGIAPHVLAVTSRQKP
jgi:hypothetical protein